MISTGSVTSAHDISVIIPSFNRPADTLRAVRSVLGQTVLPGELLIVDDGSDRRVAGDDLKALAERQGCAIRLIRHPSNRGAAAARNTGVAEAGGSHVAFLDSDDIWLPGKLECQIPFLDPAAPMLAVACGWGEWRSGQLVSTIRVPRPGRDLAIFVSACWFAPGSTLLISKQALRDVGRFDETLPRLEDYEWFLRFARKGGTLEVAPVEGARIAIGTRYASASVREAARRIHARHGDLPAGLRRVMSAYLYQQRAAAELADGHLLGFAHALGLSLLARPRTSFHIGTLWDSVARVNAV